jgi:hypothetical protein
MRFMRTRKGNERGHDDQDVFVKNASGEKSLVPPALEC